MKHITVCAALLLLSAGASVADRPDSPPGTQVIVARSSNHNVDIDGDLAPAEWSGASIRTLYDDDNLYVAVSVADETLMDDGPVAWLDDDVEIFVDGDRQPGDVDAGVFMGQPNNEGFQLITSLGNERLTEPDNFPPIVWESRAGPAPRGFVVEVRIPLDSINTHDTSPWTDGSPGFRRPEPGDAIGFNVAVGDDDGAHDDY